MHYTGDHSPQNTRKKKQVNPSFRHICFFSFFHLKLEAWFHATFDSMKGVLQDRPQKSANASNLLHHERDTGARQSNC